MGSQLDGPADYRPQMIPFNAHGRPNNQLHQQQRHPPQQRPREHHPLQQQQPHHQRGQPPHMQAKPVHQAQAVGAQYQYLKQHEPALGSAVTALLHTCTADTPLSGSQVIAVTDVAGSLRELVLLALGAKNGDEECVHRLGSALGNEQAMEGVVDFFSGEFEVE